ncbi:Protein of unknown function (DUF2911) [Flavobacterium tiangeerense]|uniref:DUF2911 family protein n=1 Tax=Flavobacterium tiangeerense TaxID=459471 RepID=A0ABY3FKN9_9FLAO|nr:MULTISPECIES: DUF2911 domain-containing protein [Flavobacterium]QZK90389.1 DUF2911 domain-containing protein [Flavobacterium sp. CHNK8]TWI00511.1 Protein of unknown function (DUF2911) [Flavobacterium tiangeerense]
MKSIIKTGFAIIALLLVNVMGAQSKPTSSKETITGKIKDATITVDYGSPSVNGRKIWGELVPFDKIWRAGANDATTFETDKDLTVEGSKLPAGKYSFFIIPNGNECTIIFNKVAKQWGAYKYKQEDDQLRVVVKPEVLRSAYEKLTYEINSNTFSLKWDNWSIPVQIK